MKTYIQFTEAVLQPGGIKLNLQGQQLVFGPQIAQPGQPDVITPASPSPDGTRIVPGSGALVDYEGAVWTMNASGQIIRNGEAPNGSGDFVDMIDKKVYAKNGASWFIWDKQWVPLKVKIGFTYQTGVVLSRPGNIYLFADAPIGDVEIGSKVFVWIWPNRTNYAGVSAANTLPVGPNEITLLYQVIGNDGKTRFIGRETKVVNVLPAV